MLKFVMNRKNRIDAVIVYMTSRFSRTGTKSFSIIDDLLDRGIPVFSATSSYDARTADGRMLQGVELLMAEHENSIKSQAVKDNGARALRAGRWIQQVPRGYDMHTTRAQQTITVNREGRLIAKAFRMKLDEGLTNEEVRLRMDTMGLKIKKQQWSNAFRNPFYAGFFSHPFLEGEIIRGPHEPLVSVEGFLKINGIVASAHGRGYETTNTKEYAPLLGTIRCPVCGGKLTAAASTKMRKKYGRTVGYYVCGHKGCRCNVSARKVNALFEELLDGISIPEGLYDLLLLQLQKAFPLLNRQGQEEVSAIKMNLTKKEEEIERIETNLATAANAKVQEICCRQLEKAEAEKALILAELEERDKSILNLEDFMNYGMSLKDNMLKLWQIANLSKKRSLQNLIFPEGIVWSKENDDIEPISKNEFLFVFDLKSSSCEQKQKRQTEEISDLSPLAPLLGLEPRTP